MSRLGTADHVWVKRVAEGPELDRFELTLDGSERSRAAAFVREADRRTYVAAHGLLRLALSWALPSVDPAAWRFRATGYGKPELADGRSGIRFSLSHCPTYAAVALSDQGECGVDAECAERSGDLDSLAESVLSPRELAWFRAAAGHRRRWAFLRCWTLKEAYAKAVGLGLRLPFDQLDFCFGTPIELIDARTSGQPVRDWSFEHWTQGATSFAVAFRRTPGTCRSVVSHDIDAESRYRVPQVTPDWSTDMEEEHDQEVHGNVPGHRLG
jgi:4'-phosphopantetheinyl transferase